MGSAIEKPRGKDISYATSPGGFVVTGLVVGGYFEDLVEDFSSSFKSWN
jgi:hypothetical protein